MLQSLSLTPTRGWWQSWALLFACLVAVPQFLSSPSASVFAQDEAEEEAAPAAAAAEEPAAGAEGEGEAKTPHASKSTLWWLIETSGWIGAILLIISIYFVSKVMQLFIELRPQVVMPPQLMAQWEEQLNQRNYKAIYQTARESESELGELVAAGMSSMQSGLEEARESIERTGEVMSVNMESKISMLAVIGSLGPMIGLLGTLKGMIASFSVIALSDQALKASEVAGGISEALVLTFEGVALSVPAIYFFALFKNRVSTLSVEAQNAADEFIRKVYSTAQSRQPAAAAASAPSA